MKQDDVRILNTFAEMIRKRFPDAGIWTFGSRVRGDSDDSSDLDVCVVLDVLNEQLDRQVMEIAWEVSFENSIVISTMTFSREDFERGTVSHSSFVRSVKKYGVAA